MFRLHKLFKSAVFIFLLFCFLTPLSKADEKPEVYAPSNSWVDDIAFSADGKFILSGSADGIMRLWDVATGKEIRQFIGHSMSINSVVFSPDGKFVLSGGSDKTIRLWDVNIGKEIKQFIGHTEFVKTVVFLPDGKSILSSSFDKTMRFWDIETGKEIKQFIGHTEFVSSIRFSPDGKLVLSGGSEEAILWNLESGEEIKRFNDSCSQAYFSPDGKYFLGRLKADKTKKDWVNFPQIWEIETGKVVKQFIDKSDFGGELIFSHDGKFVLTASDSIVKVWDVNTGKEIRQSKKCSSSFTALALSPDGTLVASGSSLGDIKIWDLSTGEDVIHLAGYAAHIFSVGFSPDNKTAFSASGKSLKSWDLLTGKGIRQFSGHADEVTSLSISHDGKSILSSSKDKTVKLWDIETGKEIRSFTGHTWWVQGVTFLPGDQYALSHSSKTMKFWDVIKGKEIGTTIGDKNWTTTMIVSPDGKYAIFADESKVMHLLDMKKDGKEIKQLNGHSESIYSITFSPDSKFILSGGGDTIRLWDTETGKEIRSFEGQIWLGNFVIFSPDGKFILSKEMVKNDYNILIRDIINGKEVKKLCGENNGFTSIAVSNSGKLILTGRFDKTVTLWDVDKEKEIASMIGYENGEWAIITPEGYYNCSENGDKYLNVRIGSNIYSVDRYRETFYRPDLVKIALAGGSLSSFRQNIDVKQPPTVTIFDTPDNIDKEEVTVSLKIVDIGGGIGDVRLYVNGSAIVSDSSRGIKVVARDNNARFKNYTIKVPNGRNIIKAIAFNGENTMQSGEAIHEITASFKPLTKPSLQGLIIGINEYKNPKLSLKYAVADADLFADTLKNVAAGLFEKVNIKKLTAKEETTSENIIKELKSFQSLNPDDLFVFFVASHGTVDDGEYFLITSNVGSTSTAKLKTDALNQDTIKNLISNIPATKKLIVIDTCCAGALGDTLQVAMLTRGMSEDTAIKILSRAVGSTILSASSSAQEALEGYNDHGLFTYVLCEGLKGKADTDKDGYVKTIELANYVDDALPELAEKIFKRAQYPIVSPSGMGFPIGKVK